MTGRHSETAFETVVEAHLLAHGYVRLDRDGFDRERAIFPDTVLDFIRDTQPAEWAKLEAFHGAKTGEQVLADLRKWLCRVSTVAAGVAVIHQAEVAAFLERPFWRDESLVCRRRRERTRVKRHHGLYRVSSSLELKVVLVQRRNDVAVPTRDGTNAGDRGVNDPGGSGENSTASRGWGSFTPRSVSPW